MNPETITIISQFGPAGLLGLLWMLERRHAVLRDRQLSEAHRTLTSRENDLGTILNVVRDNTRAIATLEQTQRYMLRLAERLDQRFATHRMHPSDQAADEHR